MLHRGELARNSAQGGWAFASLSGQDRSGDNGNRDVHQFADQFLVGYQLKYVFRFVGIRTNGIR
jgi:hypothetical protein